MSRSYLPMDLGRLLPIGLVSTRLSKNGMAIPTVVPYPWRLHR